MTLHLFAHTAGDRVLRVRVLDPVAERIALAAIQGAPRYVGETTTENLDGDVFAQGMLSKCPKCRAVNAPLDCAGFAHHYNFRSLFY